MITLILALLSFFLMLGSIFLYIFGYQIYVFFVLLILGVIATLGMFINWFGGDASLEEVKLKFGKKLNYHIVEILGSDGLLRRLVVPRQVIHKHTFGRGENAQTNTFFLDKPFAFDQRSGLPVHFLMEGVSVSINPGQKVEISHQSKLISTSLVKAYQEGKRLGGDPIEKYAKFGIIIFAVLLIGIIFIAFTLNGAIGTLGSISSTISIQGEALNKLISSLPQVTQNAISIGTSGYTGEVVK